MPKKLTIDDLEKRKEKEELQEEMGEELEELYDLVMPPGTPSYIIYDLVEEFGLEPVERNLNVNIVECDKREVIALRGKLDVVKEAEQYFFQEMEAYVESC
ncbi:hypothetical protein [Methanococcoides methylutens]|uniref:Uncharacterized protein n=1 Tax=Methanococcoides methylutens MM1 TaxID=1434104 RepID=A0A0E3SRV8_METMT|nr:hypothetical protein [Methanococcoides methylutens]AKB85766.1 hypothetical protein MCMEM_1713 [Methanococcoides methylutens MM1]